MNKSDFDALVLSIKEAGKIRKKTLKPSRVFSFDPVEVQTIRKKLKQSQREFAFMIGVSVSTLQNWEQGRRQPDGPARALLRVAAVHPEAVLDALHSSSTL